ncbi:MAG: hypothetical protein KAR42_03275 [candidate division Zixibacteria bacterium]|nr:hypothetical protein [candidate division Zixibacteria bacterium]
MSDKPKVKPTLKIVIDGKEREITFEELTLSNNLAQEALVNLLVEKKIIDPKELMEYMQKIRKERFRHEPPSQSVN